MPIALIRGVGGPPTPRSRPCNESKTLQCKRPGSIDERPAAGVRVHPAAAVGPLAGPVPDPSTGALVSAGRTFATKAEAARFLATVEADVFRKVWRDPATAAVSFGEVAELWFAWKIHLRVTTQLTYRGLLDHHVLPALGGRAIGSITSLDVQAWLADRRRNSRLGSNSLSKAYRVLKAVMESAVDAELIARNPCRVKGAGQERLPDLRFASPEDVSSLVDAVEDRWKAMLLVAAYTGLRLGELAALRRRHIDLSAGSQLGLTSSSSLRRLPDDSM
jgi:hypothetical protein